MGGDAQLTQWMAHNYQQKFSNCNRKTHFEVFVVINCRIFTPPPSACPPRLQRSQSIYLNKRKFESAESHQTSPKTAASAH